MTEDFTTFTEVDDNNTFEIVSSTKIEGVAIDPWAADEMYIYKHYGEWYFGDCDIDIDGIVTDIWMPTTQRRGSMGIIGMSCVAAQPSGSSPTPPINWAFNYGGFFAYFYNPTNDNTDLDIIIACRNLSNTDTFSSATVSTQYYFTLQKSAATCTFYIYDDAIRSNLIDTLTIIVNNEPYSHLYVSGAYTTGQDPRSKLSGDIENLIINSGGDSAPTAPSTDYAENFTTYIEQDAFGENSIESAYLIKTDDNRRDQTDYIVKSFGAGYFNNIKHHVNTTCTAVFPAVSYPGAFVCWGLSNELGETGTWSDGVACYWENTDNNTLSLVLRCYTTDDSASCTLLITGYTYYLTLERSSASNVLTCKIYEEDGRTTLIDTLTISCATDTWRYCYAESGLYSSASNKFKLSGTIEYLKLLELVAPSEPGTGGPIDEATNAEWPNSDLYVTIPENQEGTVTVNFYDDEDNLIGTDTGTGGETVSTSWDGLNCEEEYSWYVVMDNGESVVTSVLWTFTCGSCNVFTIASESHPTIHLSPPKFGNGEDWQLVKNMARFGFWSERWAIHDEGIETEPLILTGYEWMDSNGDLDIFHQKFKDINDIMNKHEEVAISGLGDCVDGYYIIKNFKYKTIKGAPRAREWRLELEFSREKTW